MPFRVIGIIGLFWVALWFTIPSKLFQRPATESPAAAKTATPFSAIFQDLRFWILVVVILAVNTSWHTFRVWLPKLLEQQHGYSANEKQYYSTMYYIFADIGAWVVGLGTYLLSKRYTMHVSRIICFAVCTVLVLAGVGLIFLERGTGLLVLVCIYGFGSFGLFPVYFALSQELSGRHQGKVTGTLGFINSLYLAGMYAIQGNVLEIRNPHIPKDGPRHYDEVMFLAGIPALIALVVLILFWPKERVDLDPQKS